MATTPVTTSSASASLEMGLSKPFSRIVGEIATEVADVSEKLTNMINVRVLKFHEYVSDTVYARYNAVVENSVRYPNSYDARAGLQHLKDNFEFIKMVDILMEVGNDLEVYDKCLEIFQAKGGIKEITTAYNGDASQDVDGFSDRAKEKIAYKMGVKNPLKANMVDLQAGIEGLFHPSIQPLKKSSSSMSSLSMGVSSSVVFPDADDDADVTQLTTALSTTSLSKTSLSETKADIKQLNTALSKLRRDSTKTKRGSSVAVSADADDDAGGGQIVKPMTRVMQAPPNKGSSSGSSSKSSSTSSSRTKSSKVDSDDENDKQDTRFTSKTRTTTSTLTVPSHSSSKSSSRVPSELVPGSDAAETHAILDAGYDAALKKAGVEDSSEGDKKLSKKASTTSKASSSTFSPSSKLVSARDDSASSTTKKAATAVKKEPKKEPTSKPDDRTVGAGGQGGASYVDSNTPGNKFKNPVDNTTINLDFGATGTDDAGSDSSSFSDE